MNYQLTQQHLLALLLLAISLFISSCTRHAMAYTATYQVYIGYPKGYISEYNNKHSVLKDDKGKLITRFGGDNATTGTLGAGVQNSPNAKMEVPAKMEVMWFSVLENQFWHGEFELPSKQMAEALDKEKMLGLFTASRGQTIDKYRQIVVNVAPKGKVYVYVSGAATKLIGSYQAKAIEYDWLQHVDDTWEVIAHTKINSREEFINGMKKDYGSIVNEVAQNYNEGYFKSVQWTLRLEDCVDEFLAFTTRTLNGEHLHILKDPKDYVVSSIPRNVVFDYKYKNEVIRQKITFPNLYEFYHKHFRSDQKVEVIVRVADNDEFSIKFKQGSKEIILEDAAELREGIRIQELER